MAHKKVATVRFFRRNVSAHLLLLEKRTCRNIGHYRTELSSNSSPRLCVQLAVCMLVTFVFIYGRAVPAGVSITLLSARDPFPIPGG